MISSNGYEFIKRKEGLRLKAYPDPGTGGAPYTIGYGHTDGVRKGDTCTLQQANSWLLADCATAENILNRALPDAHRLTRGQRDALVSFIFNIGPGTRGVKDGFVTLKNGQPSTMLRMLYAHNYAAAADQFLKWVYGNGRKLPGLVTRRKEERDMFLGESAAIERPAVVPSQLIPPPISQAQGKNMGLFLPLAFNAILEAVPSLIRLFGSSEVSERNAKAVETVVKAAQTATGATNEQELIEKLDSDAEAPALVEQAVRAIAYDLFIDSGGIKEAREANVQASGTFTKLLTNPAMWMSVLLLPMVYIVVVAVVAGGTEFSDEIKVMVVTAVVTGVLGSITGFWLGTSFGSARKTDALIDQTKR